MKPRHELIFRSYENMHRVRSLACRIDCDVKPDHSDITALID